MRPAGSLRRAPLLLSKFRYSGLRSQTALLRMAPFVGLSSRMSTRPRRNLPSPAGVLPGVAVALNVQLTPPLARLTNVSLVVIAP
jgi:hypothetical protein